LSVFDAESGGRPAFLPQGHVLSAERRIGILPGRKMPNHVIYDRIWESDKLARCSLRAALAYPWIYLYADDWGRFEWNLRKMHAIIFGKRDDVRLSDFSKWTAQYEAVGLLRKYEIGGSIYCQWTRFIGPPDSRKRQSQFPNDKGAIENTGVRLCSRFQNASRTVQDTKQNDSDMLQDVNGKVPLKLETRSLKLETRNRNPPKAPQGADERFERFWQEYPKKIGKAAAKKSWDKIKGQPDILEKIIHALLWQVSSEQWTKDGGQFIPNPSTYLNQGRWEDEPVIPYSRPDPIGDASWKKSQERDAWEEENRKRREAANGNS